jgi:hypothetical protein
LGGALLGAGTGAAAGALIGSGSGHAGGGAALGGGVGLLAGTLFGSAHGRRGAPANQHRYDISYTQCMVANGERIAPPAPPAAALVYVPAPVYALAAPIPR